MTRQVPWIIAWFVSWAGLYTSLPPLLPSDAQPDAFIFNDIQTDVVVPSSALIDSTHIDSFHLVVENSCVLPDGLPRMAVLAGRPGHPTLPGPVISGNKGDRFLINVTNHLTYEKMMTGTTIHWHGIHQYRSSQMDGADGTTQCAIGQGNSFQYNFTGGDQVGTFWYHSHHAVQYCDGLRGPFIIYDHEHDKKKFSYEVDDENTIITLMDWYHYTSVTTVLINGIGCYPGLDCKPPHIFMVEWGKRYRFRLLNMACETYYNFSIEGHELTIIEVEGTYVEPHTVSSIGIFAAQRYSFILDANQPPCEYKIHSSPDPTEQNNSSDTAILRYKNSIEKCPLPAKPTVGPLNEACLRSPDTPDRLLGHPDVTYTVSVTKNDSNLNFLVDGTQYVSPTVPALLQVMNGRLPHELEPWKSIIPLEKDKVVEIIFDIDSPDRPHPFHLHGHSFVVFKSGGGICAGPGKPVMRDTVDTGLTNATNGVTIRFISDNPGPWLLHCHNEWHLWRGMALVFVEDYEGIKKQPYNNDLKNFCLHEPKDFPPPPAGTSTGPIFLPPTPGCTPTPS